MSKIRVDQNGSRKGRSRSTAAVVVVDQAVNSLSNIALTVWVANSTTLREFGTFATVQVVVTSSQVVLLGGVGDFWLRGPSTSRRRRTNGLISLFAMLGLLGALLSVVALLLGLPEIVCVVFVVAPGVAALDHVRIVLVASGHAIQALGADFVFAAMQFLAIFVWLSVTGTATAAGAWLAWAAAAYVTWAVIGVASRERRRSTRLAGRGGLSEVVNVRFAGDTVLSSAAPWAAQLVFSAQLGVSFNGLVRAAQIPFGPVSVMLQAARPVLIPRFSADVAPRVARRTFALSCVVITATVCLCTTAALVAVRTDRLKPLLGGFDIEPSFILLTGLLFAVVGVQTPVLYFLRARGHDSAVSISRGVLVVGFLVLAVVSFVAASSTLYLAGASAVWAAVVISMLVAAFLKRSSRPTQSGGKLPCL